MFCRHCGKQVNDTDLFCSSCGGSLRAEPQQIQEEPQPHSQQAPAQEEFTASFYAAPTNTNTPPTQSYYVEQPATVHAELTPREREEKKSRASTILALGIVSLALSVFSLIVFSVGISLLSDDFYSAFLGVTLGCAIINLPALVLGIISRSKGNRFLRDYGKCTPKSRTGSHLANAGRIMATVLLPFFVFFFFY